LPKGLETACDGGILEDFRRSVNTDFWRTPLLLGEKQNDRSRQNFEADDARAHLGLLAV
jgi:hypothetical protein